MFKLARFPAQLKGYFSSLTSDFHWDHHRYFSELVLLIAVAWGRRNISNLVRQLDSRGRPHRSRVNSLFLAARRDLEQALEHKAYDLLNSLQPRAGERLYFILDDSKRHKRGRKMEAVDWLLDPTTGRKIPGSRPKLSSVAIITDGPWSSSSRTPSSSLGWANTRIAPCGRQLHTCTWCASPMPS